MLYPLLRFLNVGQIKMVKKKTKTRIKVEKALKRLKGKGYVNYHLVRAEAGRGSRRNPSYDNVLWELTQMQKEGKVKMRYNPKKWNAERFKVKV